MKTILTEPMAVKRLAASPKRKVITIDISGVSFRKRLQVIENWKQALAVHNQINAA